MADKDSAPGAAFAEVDIALGRLTRGIVHEAANPLNSILMNAELAQASIGDNDAVVECLDAIARAARESGARLRELTDLATAADFRPQSDQRIGDVLDVARGLLGARATRGACRVSFSATSATQAVPLHRMALAGAVALLLDALLLAGASRIGVIATQSSDHLDVTLEADIGLKADGLDAIATRFATRVCADHGGAFEHDSNRLSLRLPITATE